MTSLKIFFLTAIVYTAVSAPMQAWSFENGGRGGGDDVGIEFHSSFIQGLDALKRRNPTLYRELANFKPLELLDNAKLVTVDTPLAITFNGLVQNCVAENDPESMVVSINRKRWNSISSSDVKRGLALHEILSLHRVEGTGQYRYSGQFLAGFSLPDLRPSDASTFPKNFDYQAMSRAFTAASPTSLDQAQGKWVQIGQTGQPAYGGLNAFFPSGKLK